MAKYFWVDVETAVTLILQKQCKLPPSGGGGWGGVGVFGSNHCKLLWRL